ncbi:DNA topoisomerase III [Pelistega sp. NLN82]|uniref:DNA topoisomerase n=1 Tax=Pelistega ratti TaxID=2652177 RepID=A0A6L9Y4C9_9BURK|nr:DNA topoisomerase III [Pelistega ratti]NEN75241.1 DNA topoisomerase III [Pelistega ratti]
MAKTLIIAEKPSVAQDISRALGGFERHDGYFENDQYVLSSSVGHLLTLFNPDDVVRGKWSFTHLPAIPKNGFDIQPADKKSQDRLKLLVKLLKRKDVDAIINACDAGREGELIFRYIVQYAKVNKPIQRLWLQSMTKQAIVDAFHHLRSDESMKPLEAAARSRAEADWLVGINGTRAMTAFNSKDGGFFKTPIGRVQTPTLAIVYGREQKIRQFQPKDYWEVHASFVAQAGIYEGVYFDKNFKKDPNDPDKKENRLWSEVAAKAIVMACQHKTGHVTEESKPQTSASPLLYDLTSLQREANSRFGFSAKTTLALAQALYERHKVITYPRTDSRYLPEDYINTVNQTLHEIAESTSSINQPHIRFAKQILSKAWVKPNKRIFDNKKVSDHFAIIPTSQVPKELSDAEAKVYDLITKRFMAIFYPPAEYLVTTRITTVGEIPFKTEGKVLVSAGWLEVYGRTTQEGEESLVPVAEHEQVQTEEVRIEAFTTKPPPHYTEATLLSAMEGAGKLVEDDELREAMSERGLGTPATRATIIEGLIADQYLRREGRDLIPTTKTRQLMTLLNGLNIKELTSPELTGEWEHKLKQIEQGTLDRRLFMQEIAQSTQIIVKRAKEYEHDTIPGDYVTLKTPCPVCGHVVKENYRRYACTHCDFSITKNPGGRNFETEEVETLLNERSIGPLSGFISKLGRPFSAILRLTEDNKLEFDFGQSEEDSKEDIDFSALRPLGSCPKCGQGHIFDVGMNYICDQSANTEKPCDFKSSKVILQQEISEEQMSKLLATGKTDLLENFVSNRTNRKFKAYLVLDAKGKIGFEFEERGTASKSARKTVSKTASKTVAKKTTRQSTSKK